MSPRHTLYHPARNPPENRRYALPPEVEAKSRIAVYPSELAMLLRLGGVILAGAALATCVMMAAG
jgi:hypothetical protein